MLPPNTLLKPQIFSLIPNYPFSISNPSSSISTQTLTFPRKPISISLNSFPQSHYQGELVAEEEDDDEDEDEDEDGDEEHVIGDCIVFEEGVFEDPFLQDDYEPKKPINKRSMAMITPEDLVPDEWKEAQAEINITKKEKRKIAQQIEFNSSLSKKNRAVPVKSTKEYLSYKEYKMSQLKKSSLELKEDVGEEEGGLGSSSSSLSTRVAPRNPRLAVYKGTLDDISEFFHSGDYQPGESTGQKAEGPRKLFTKEEKALLNKRIPNLEGAASGKWLPLHTLATSGEFYLVDTLLKYNVDINGADKDGLTALHKAILSKKQAVTNYLLRESANPFVRDQEGATLMHYAVLTASSHTIKILLLYNVDINLQDDDGWTPLHLAVQSRRTDMVRLLLIKGADKTLRNRDGLTPLELCLYFGRDTRTYELVKLLKQLPKPKKTTDSATTQKPV